MTSWWIITIKNVLQLFGFINKVSWCIHTVAPFPCRAACIFGVNKPWSIEKKTSRTKKRVPDSEWLWGLSAAVPGKLQHTQQGSRSVTTLWVWEGLTALHPALGILPCTSLLASPLNLCVKVWLEAGLPFKGFLAHQTQPQSSLVSPDLSLCRHCWQDGFLKNMKG